MDSRQNSTAITEISLCPCLSCNPCVSQRGDSRWKSPNCELRGLQDLTASSIRKGQGARSNPTQIRGNCRQQPVDRLSSVPPLTMYDEVQISGNPDSSRILDYVSLTGTFPGLNVTIFDDRELQPCCARAHRTYSHAFGTYLPAKPPPVPASFCPLAAMKDLGNLLLSRDPFITQSECRRRREVLH